MDVIDSDLYKLDNILYDGMFNYPYNWQVLSTFLLISQNNKNSLNIFKENYTVLAESLSIDAKEKAMGIPINKLLFC